MAHKTRVNGTNYSISGGKARVNSTNYSISKGKTRVSGTNYAISFTTVALITFYLDGEAWQTTYTDWNSLVTFGGSQYGLYWSDQYGAYLQGWNGGLATSDGTIVGKYDSIVDGGEYTILPFA